MKPTDQSREIIVLKRDATAARRRWINKGWKIESVRTIFQKGEDTGTVCIIATKPKPRKGLTDKP